MRHIHPIRTREDYDRALAEVAAYFENQPEPNTEEGDRFELLCDLVEHHESTRFPIPAADPVRVLEYVIETMGRSRVDLNTLIGPTRASEIMNRRRRLTLEQMHAIGEAWHLPIAALSAPYEIRAGRPAMRARKIVKKSATRPHREIA